MTKTKKNTSVTDLCKQTVPHWSAKWLCWFPFSCPLFSTMHTVFTEYFLLHLIIIYIECFGQMFDSSMHLMIFLYKLVIIFFLNCCFICYYEVSLYVSTRSCESSLTTCIISFREREREYVMVVFFTSQNSSKKLAT